MPKKALSKKATKKKPAKAKAPKPIGKITHFYDKICVGVLKLKAAVKLGDVLLFKGRKGEFVQVLTSMQFDHKPIAKAAKGKEIGVKLNQKAEEGDLVYRATE